MPYTTPDLFSPHEGWQNDTPENALRSMGLSPRDLELLDRLSSEEEDLPEPNLDLDVARPPIQKGLSFKRRRTDNVLEFLKENNGQDVTETLRKAIKGKKRLPALSLETNPTYRDTLLEDYSFLKEFSGSRYQFIIKPLAYVQTGVRFDVEKLTGFYQVTIRDSLDPTNEHHGMCSLGRLNFDTVVAFFRELNLKQQAEDELLVESVLIFFLKQVFLFWGIIPCYIPSSSHTISLPPAVREVWKSAAKHQIRNACRTGFPTYYGTEIYQNYLSQFINEHVSFSPSLSYGLSAPPVVQFTEPYTERAPDKYADNPVTTFYQLQALLSQSASARLLCTASVLRILADAGIFPNTEDLFPEEQLIYLCAEPLSSGLCKALPSNCLCVLRSPSDLEKAKQHFRKRATEEPLSTLWVSFENDFFEECTLPDLLPFLHCCTTLILCGTTLTPALRRQLNVLPLDSRELDQASTTLTEAVSLLSTDKMRDFLLYILNELLAYRAKAIERRMIFNSLRRVIPELQNRQAVPYSYTLPEKEASPFLESNQLPYLYAATVPLTKNSARSKDTGSEVLLARRAASRLRTILDPLEVMCQSILKERKLFRSMKGWKECLCCSLLLDMIASHFDPDTITLNMQLPEKILTFETVLDCIVQCSSPTAFAAPIKPVLEQFYNFVRGLSLCDSLDSYLSTPSRLGWKDNATIHLDYERFWPAFLQYAKLDASWESRRNQFLRENFRPGQPGGAFAYATDSRDGHWGHRIRKDKNSKPIGSFLRLKIEILK